MIKCPDVRYDRYYGLPIYVLFLHIDSKNSIPSTILTHTGEVLDFLKILPFQPLQAEFMRIQEDFID